MKILPHFVSCLLFISLLLSCGENSIQVKKSAEEIYAKSALNGPLPPRIFKSDGCSCWPNGDWGECCIKHDLSYWVGGTREDRKNADLELRKCVSEKGHPLIAQIMYVGVRIGGVWWLPTPFRWGFGWGYPQSGPPGKSY